MLASDYAGVGSKGEMRDKAAQLEHMKSQTDTFTDSKNDTMKVRVYAPNLATVCGTSTEKGKRQRMARSSAAPMLGRYVDGSRRTMAMHSQLRNRDYEVT